jgi:hypothetical protein
LAGLQVHLGPLPHDVENRMGDILAAVDAVTGCPTAEHVARYLDALAPAFRQVVGAVAQAFEPTARRTREGTHPAHGLVDEVTDDRMRRALVLRRTRNTGPAVEPPRR